MYLNAFSLMHTSSPPSLKAPEDITAERRGNEHTTRDNRKHFKVQCAYKDFSEKTNTNKEFANCKPLTFSS